MVKENLVIYLVQSEEIFQTVPYSVEEAQEKGKKKMQCWPENRHENLVPLPTFLSLHQILRFEKLSQKHFQLKCSLLNAQPKGTKKQGKINERRGEE